MYIIKNIWILFYFRKSFYCYLECFFNLVRFGKYSEYFKIIMWRRKDGFYCWII